MHCTVLLKGSDGHTVCGVTCWTMTATVVVFKMGGWSRLYIFCHFWGDTRLLDYQVHSVHNLKLLPVLNLVINIFTTIWVLKLLFSVGSTLSR